MFQRFAVYYEIKEAVVKQKLGALKTFRQVFLYGFLYYTRPGKADKRLRLGNVDVAQHSVRSCNATRGRIGHQGYIG